MEIPSNPQAPHRAVIFIQAEVHELLSTGECSGRPVVKIKQFPVYLDGPDRWMAERRLNELLAEVKTKCKTQG